MNMAFLQSNQRKKYYTLLILFALTSISMAEMDIHVPMGWAVVPTSVGVAPSSGVNVESTIGGGDGKVVTAKGGELAQYAGSSEPLVIMAEGSFSGDIKVAAHKTIIGTGSGATLKGGFALGSNVILRNFTISGGIDGLQVSKNSSIWIDHCDLSSCSDGLLDITNGSDKVTASWIKFHDHNKVMLINKGNQGGTDDNGRNSVTLHHSSFINTVQRHPRCGYGKIHILNNYYNGCSEYAIHVYWNSQVVIERNYFTGVSDAVSDHYPNQQQGDWPGPGYVILIDNYTDTPGSIKKTSTKDPERTFTVDKFYMYDWVVTQDAQKVPDVVKNGAGPGEEWGKIGAIPTPGQGYAKVSTNPTLKWTKVGSNASNKVYFGTTNPPPEVTTVEGYSYKPGKLSGGTVYYWKINDGDVWKFRTEGPVSTNKKYSVVKTGGSKNSTLVQKVGVLGKSGSFIGVKAGTKKENIYLLNGKEITRGVKKQLHLKEEKSK